MKHVVMDPDILSELRREMAADLISDSFRTGRHHDLLTGLLWQTIDHFREGDPHAERLLAELREHLASRDDHGVGRAVGGIDVMIALRAGRLDVAETAACANVMADERQHTAQLVAIRWFQGRLAELIPSLEGLARTPTPSADDTFFDAALALATAIAGDRRQAAATIRRLCDQDLNRLPHSGSWLLTMHSLAEASHLLKDPETATRVYDLLQPFAHLPAMDSQASVCLGSVHQALGVASLTIGDLDTAAHHLRSAHERNLALAHWPAVVQTSQRLSQALVRRASPSDAAAARAALADAREISNLKIVSLGTPQTQPTDRAAICSRIGQNWKVELGSRSVMVEHRVGMYHLAVLLANPDQDIEAIDLVAGLDALSVDSEDHQAKTVPDAERSRIAVGKAIRRAVAHIGESDTIIADHLQRHVGTGVRCSYRPS